MVIYWGYLEPRGCHCAVVHKVFLCGDRDNVCPKPLFPPASSDVRHGYSQKRKSIAPEAAQELHVESCSYISVIFAAFQGLTERSSSGARGEFLPPLESAFFDTFFHASAERKYEEIEFSRNGAATRRYAKLRFFSLFAKVIKKPSCNLFLYIL